MRRLIILCALVALAGGIYYWQTFVRTDLSSPRAGNDASASASHDTATNHYPVVSHSGTEEASSANSSSSTAKNSDDTDASLEQSLSDIFGADRFANLFNREDVVRHFVVTIENAESPKLPLQFSPIKPVPGIFVVMDNGSDHFIGSENYKRYTPYVELLTNTDLKKLTALYSRIYPFIQNAYQDLGTKAYFNDKLVEVIDHVLSSPEPEGPIKVIPLSVSVKYADPNLEKLSAAQKIMVRMGPQNSRKIKEKLHELRELLVHLDK
jgi:hypothetical protein